MNLGRNTQSFADTTPVDCLIRGRWRGTGAPIELRLWGGRVRSIRPAGRATPDFGSDTHILSPPLLDIQVNGANGVDLQDPQLDTARLASITRYLSQRGVGRWVPTLVTMPLDAMEQACRVIAVARREDPNLARAIPGIHIEGPFISPLDGPRGAHPLAHVRPPDWKAFQRLLRASEHSILYTTLAPELPGAKAFIRRAVAAGVRVSLGHHHAEAEQVHAAAQAGATLCTHLGNGVMAILPRHHNPLWPQLDEPRLAASLIADLHHLPPEVLRVMVRAKGAARIVLASDCTHLSGLKPGRYPSFGQEVELCRDGAIRIPGSPLLAGSAATLDECLRRAVSAGALTWPQAIASATSIPARLLGIKAAFARPREGAKAAFALLNPAIS